MKLTRTALGVILGLSILIAIPAHAGDVGKAATAYENGKQLLEKGAFADALKAFAEAAKADRDNKAYRDQYTLVRRIIKMRKALANQRNEEKWEATAHALRAFYYENKILTEALALDKMFHEKHNTPETAARLAETMLELGQNDEAIEMLGAIEADRATLSTRTLLGIAYAREAKHTKAREIARNCSVPDGASPGEMFELARLHTLVGDNTEALAALTRCFEGVPPSRLDSFKAYAKAHPDLTVLTRHIGFPKAFATASKVKESGCSSGANCATCPSRSKGCATKPSKPAAKGS